MPVQRVRPGTNPWATESWGSQRVKKGDLETARYHYERCIAIVEHEGEEPALEKLNLGVLFQRSGDVAKALELFEDALGFWRRYSVLEGVAFGVLNRGLALLELGDVDGARRDVEEACECFEAIGYRAKHAHALQGLAATEAAAGRHLEASRLLGRADSILSDVAWVEGSSNDAQTRQVENAARRELGDDAYEAAFEEGRADAG